MIDVGTDEILSASFKGTEDISKNPWGDMDVRDIQIEIVDDLHDSNDTIIYQTTICFQPTR